MESRTEIHRDIYVILVMMGCIAAAAVITLLAIKAPPTPGVCIAPPGNPTPRGYTASLAFFVIPIVVLVIHNFRHPDTTREKRQAMIGSALAVTILGTVLDVGFSFYFFCFPNVDAVIGLRLPAIRYSAPFIVPGYIPIEEFGFYILGGIFMIMVYIWADHDWLSAYTQGDVEATDPRTARLPFQPPLVRISPLALGMCAGLILAAVLVKRWLPAPANEGFPGYFTFLVLLAFLPAAVCIKAMHRVVNWRAFAFALWILLTVSVIWEATMGVPYNWWNYKYDQMIGIHVLPWAGLPIEAVLLWVAASFGSVGAYEVFRVYFHFRSRMGLRELLFGKPLDQTGSSS